MKKNISISVAFIILLSVLGVNYYFNLPAHDFKNDAPNKAKFKKSLTVKQHSIKPSLPVIKVADKNKIAVLDNKKNVVQIYDNKNENNISQTTASRTKHILDLFENEAVDTEWAYSYQTKIRESLIERLNISSSWIDNLECRSTMCLLKISSSAQGNNIYQETANTISAISKEEWHKGSTSILRVSRNDDLNGFELVIGRNDDS